MKNLLKKVLSVAAATALLMTSVISASAADHTHNGAGTALGEYEGTPEKPEYTITLTAPPSGTNPEKHVHYAAYQVFSGTPEEQSDPVVNPGKKPAGENTLPITNIKFGDAFGVVNSRTWQANIVDFIYALGTLPEGEYAYAFGKNFGFKDFVNKDYKSGTGGGQQLADKFYKSGLAKTNENVDFDYLAVEVANVIAAHQSHTWLAAFCDILGGFASASSTTSSYLNEGHVAQYYQGYGSGYTDGVKNAYPYEIRVPAGYYMVVDLSTIDLSGDIDTDEAYSARMLFVANNVTQQSKASVPTLTKEILRKKADGTDDDNDYSTEVAGVGDTVKFQLTGTLPSDYALYLGGYQYKFIDTLTDGLDFVGTNEKPDVDISVTGKVVKSGTASEEKVDVSSITGGLKIKTDSYDSNAHVDTHIGKLDSDDQAAYSVVYTGRTMTITFPCLKEIVLSDGTSKYLLCSDSKIVVTYSAKVNNDAVVGKTGNTNEAKIQFSNNPQAYDDTNYTHTSTSTVYTFGLNLNKNDAASFIQHNSDPETYPDEPSVLNGVQFALLRPTNVDNQYEIASINAGGEITSWNNDSSEPVTITGANGKGLRHEISKAVTAGLKDVYISTTDGKLSISGLDAGVTYTLLEISTNDGYALIDPFTFTLTADVVDDDTDEYNGLVSSDVVDHELSAKSSEASLEKFVINNESSTEDDDGYGDITVLNFKYTDLPSTGGIGVYIYYIAGGCVVALALVLFALSKKKKTTK